MNLYIDINSRQAVNGIGVASPIQPITFKDQDTPSVNIYFVLEGVVQDEGSGTAIKFGLNLPPPNPISLLVYDTAFTRQTDVNGNIFYQGFPVFYTSQLAAALGSSTSIACVGEVRTQLSDGEIFRSMDIPFMIWRTILLETTTPPPSIVNVYPDASTLEIIPHKDQPSGYAGLNTSGLLNGAEIPVDGVTIQILDGQIAAAPILAETSATFVTPAAHANITVTLVSSTGLIAGQYVRLPVAGYYIVESITDSTHAVLQNNGDPVNAASGVTIAVDTPLLPAQAAAGGGGSPGQNAYTTTTASFIVPAIGATVPVAVASTAWMGGSGYYVFITGAGYYAVNSITDSTHVVLTNTGSPSNAIAGTTIGSPATVAAAGPAGAAGTPGTSGAALSAYDALASPFTMPAAAANVTISIANTAWLGVGQVIYIASAGYFQVASISSATQVAITNLNYPGNASAGGTIASGSKVSAGGLIGATGSGGAGKNAFTNLATNFTQPAVNATVSINVGTTAWMAVGQIVFVQGGGYYSVASITDLTDALVTNLGYAGNAAPGATVTSGSTIAVTPGGLAGTKGGDAFTTTTASFTMPAVASPVTVTIGASAWIAQGQNLYVAGAGYFSVSAVTDSTHVVLTNSGVPGNVVSGTVIASGAQVSAAGSTGLQGATGPQGPTGGISDAPTDGQLYGRKSAAWSVVSGGGGGGAFDPRGGYFAYQDFETNGPTSNFPYWSGQATVGTAAGIKWANTNILSDSTHKAIGVVELQTGNVTGNSGCFLCYGGTGINSTNGGIMLGPGTMDLASRMAIETSLPATGTGYLCRFGLQIANAVTPPITPVNSVFLEYSPDNNSGNLRLGYNTASGAIIYVNTSQALTADTFAWWELKIDTSGNITAYFNGVSIATAGPIAGLLWTQLAPFWYNFRNSGTAIIYVAVDTLFASMPYTR